MCVRNLDAQRCSRIPQAHNSVTKTHNAVAKRNRITTTANNSEGNRCRSGTNGPHASAECCIPDITARNSTASDSEVQVRNLAKGCLYDMEPNIRMR